jgi:hypothetical protein
MVTHASSNVLASTFFVFCCIYEEYNFKLLPISRPSTACENEMTVEQHVVLHESYINVVLLVLEKIKS